MFSRFILATDLSPASFAVVRSVGALQAMGSRHCLLLHCLSMEGAVSAAFSYNAEAVEQALAEQASILVEQGLTVETRTAIGAARREVNRIAAEEEFSLIVVGSQGRSLIGEKLLGGVAYGILSHARQAVLVVPVTPQADDAPPRARQWDFQAHVLFATDFSEPADNAFAHVRRLVAEGVRQVTLVHVQDKVKLERHLEARLDEFNAVDRDRLEALKRVLVTEAEVEVGIELSYGVPAQEITRLIEQRSAHLVVMGTQGRGFAGELVLGSVSHRVARSAAVPVLLIPADCGESAH